MPKLPRIIDRRTAARTRLFHVEQLDLEFSNGNVEHYERLVGAEGGAVLVVPMLDDETVLLIREYAAGVHRYELGLPKGKVEGREPLLEAAHREIQEEVGYGARRLRHLTTLSVAPGYLAYSTHIVLAQELYPSRLEGDEPEEIEVVPWKLENLPELLGEEDFTEARSLAAPYLVRDTLERDRVDADR